MNANTARQRSSTYADLARAFSEAEPGLEREFTRLFVGPGRPVAHPYESVYREGRTMGDATMDVRRRLTREGLAPCRQTIVDHIGIELAFMALLAAREARAWDDGDKNEARHWLTQQESFLRDHLCTWLPQFCRRVMAGRPLAFYDELTQHAETFVTGDAARVRLWLGEDAAEGERLVVDRQSWNVTVGHTCTLCHLCVQVCQPGALRGVRDEFEGVISLRAAPALCDGCAACERWCPEEAIKVRRLQDCEPNADRELAQSALLSCPSCGRAYVPEALLAKVQAQMGGANQALLQRQLLCLDCKTTHVPLRRRNTTQPGASGLASDLSSTLRRNR